MNNPQDSQCDTAIDTYLANNAANAAMFRKWSIACLVANLCYLGWVLVYCCRVKIHRSSRFTQFMVTVLLVETLAGSSNLILVIMGTATNSEGSFTDKRTFNHCGKGLRVGFCLTQFAYWSACLVLCWKYMVVAGQMKASVQMELLGEQ